MRLQASHCLAESLFSSGASCQNENGYNDLAADSGARIFEIHHYLTVRSLYQTLTRLPVLKENLHKQVKNNSDLEVKRVFSPSAIPFDPPKKLEHRMIPYEHVKM